MWYFIAGNYGNTMDGKNESVKKVESSEEEEEEEEEEEVVTGDTAPDWKSTTAEVKPMSRDRSVCVCDRRHSTGQEKYHSRGQTHE